MEEKMNEQVNEQVNANQQDQTDSQVGTGNTEEQGQTASYLAQPGKKKNKKVLKIVLAVIAVIVIVGGLFTYKAVKDQQYREAQENLIQSEMMKITLEDPTTDSIDMTIQSEGEYGEVEKTMKEYFQEIFTTIQTLDGLQNDERFTILTGGESDEYWNDSPNFYKTTEAINTFKSEMGAQCDTMTSLLDEQTIKDREDKKWDDYYKKLYESYMLSDTTKTEFTSINTSTATSRTQWEASLDKRMEIVNFLKSNSGKWELQNKQVYFHSQDLVDQYNKLVEELNAMAAVQ